MSTSTTTNLSLTKDNADEPIINLRSHNNDNLDAIDTAIKALQDAITNANALLGTLGVTNGTPDITAASARSTLGAATAGGAAATLYDAEQAIATLTGAVGNVDVTNDGTLQSQINSVRDSVSPYTIDLVTRSSAMTFPTSVSLYTNRPNTVTLIGHIVVLCVSIQIANATSGDKSIQGYLPEDLRPSSNILMSCETGLGDGKMQSVTITPVGSLSAWPVNTGKTTYAIGCCVYVV